MRVINLHCADGWSTVPIVRIASHVAAIDLDPRMLQLTRAALQAAGLANYDLVGEMRTTLLNLYDSPRTSC